MGASERLITNLSGGPTMRRTSLAACAALLIAGAAPADNSRPGDRPVRNKLEGTWEHTFADQPQLHQVKLINQDHFIWVTYEVVS